MDRKEANQLAVNAKAKGQAGPDAVLRGEFRKRERLVNGAGFGRLTQLPPPRKSESLDLVTRERADMISGPAVQQHLSHGLGATDLLESDHIGVDAPAKD